MCKREKIVVDFTAFGLNEPTEIVIYTANDEYLKYSTRGKSVEMLSKRIKEIVRLFEPCNVSYKTSPYLYEQIRRKTLICPVKTVWQLFYENGIKIQGE